MTAEAPLLDSFATAIARFTGGAGVAVYRRAPAADYEAVRSTLAAAPPRIDENEPVVVTLRETNAPRPAGAEMPGVEHALPMSHRRTLHGFVLIGPKPDVDTYRPDELEVLAFAAHQVGLDLHALQNESLAAENERLRLRGDALEQALQSLAATPRRGTKQGTSLS
jgi:hypothetical protein